MENEENCLSPIVQAVLTISVAAGILLCVASGNMFFALMLVVAMVELKRHAIKCYNKRIDKIYFYAYLVSAVLLAILLVMQNN